MRSRTLALGLRTEAFASLSDVPHELIAMLCARETFRKLGFTGAGQVRPHVRAVAGRDQVFIVLGVGEVLYALEIVPLWCSIDEFDWLWLQAHELWDRETEADARDALWRPSLWCKQIMVIATGLAEQGIPMPALNAALARVKKRS